MSEESWPKLFSLTINEALAAGIPRSIIEAAWRQTDALLGTNAADDNIREYFDELTGITDEPHFRIENLKEDE